MEHFTFCLWMLLVLCAKLFWEHGYGDAPKVQRYLDIKNGNNLESYFWKFTRISRSDYNELLKRLRETGPNTSNKNGYYENIFFAISDAIGKSLSVLKVPTDPDWGLSIEELTHKHGYNIKTHEVTTEDGYILKLHHLSHDSKNTSASKKPVVFLMHPLAFSSRIWVYLGPTSLGYALVNAGYDVWMGNARGTRYGRSHIKMDPNNDPEFWDFSFDEVGYYDLPAMIDYVLRETRMQELLYIGHSQGNSAFFSMASRRPEYNKKIKAAVAAAPIVFITGLRYKIILPFITIFIKLVGFQELFRPGPLVPQFGRILCSGGPTNICELISGLGFGLSFLADAKMFALETCTGPEGFSSKMVLHYYQLIRSGDEFKRYDYGIFGNMAKYGQHTAPNIDVSKVTAPVALFYGPNDPLTPTRNIKKLENILPNVQLVHEIKNKHFNHLDFVSAKNRDVLFHTPLISYLDSFVHTSVK